MYYRTLLLPFKGYLADIGYAKGTRAMIARCTERFLVYGVPTAIRQVSPAHILGFYEQLKAWPCKNRPGLLSAKSVYDHIYSLRVFFAWLETSGQICENPISALRFKQPQSKARQPLTMQAIHALFKAADNWKEKATLHLFYSCGLRRQEAVDLKAADVYPRLNILVVRAGKNKKRRVIPITDKVKQDVSNYLVERDKAAGSALTAAPAFMINHYGRSMSGGCYDKVLQKIMARCALPLHCTPHVLRHSIATHLLENGCSLEYVRDFLGHQHLESTAIYTKITQLHLKNDA